MISSSRADLISRSSKLQMYPDVWMGSCQFMKGIRVKMSIKGISTEIDTDCSSTSWALTSGSRFLKTYILVFSIMENSSGLSFAHFMSQTSLRSNLAGSPAGGWVLLVSSEEPAASRSSKVITPAMSIMARRLKKSDIWLKATTAERTRWRCLPTRTWCSPGVAVEWQIVWSVV